MVAALQKLSLSAALIEVAPFNERMKTWLSYICGYVSLWAVQEAA